MRVLLPLVLLLSAGPGSTGPGPDLSAGNLTLVSGTAGAGEPVLLSLVVRNPGPAAVGPFRVKALLAPRLPVAKGDPEIGSTEVASLAGGGEVAVDLDGFVPAATAPGRYRLGAFIDPENLCLDPVRSNNGAATAAFTVEREPGAMALGDEVDLGLGPLGKDSMDLPIPAGAEAVLRARGVRGVRPVLRIREPGGGAVLAERAGGGSALLAWTAPAAGTYRAEVANLASTIGRVRLRTAGSVRIRGRSATAPASIPFAAWEDGTVRLSALYEGDAAPLLFRQPPGDDVSSPGVARGRRARLGPVAPLATGASAAVLGGEGAATVTILSRTPRPGDLHVR